MCSCTPQTGQTHERGETEPWVEKQETKKEELRDCDRVREKKETRWNGKYGKRGTKGKRVRQRRW